MGNRSQENQVLKSGLWYTVANISIRAVAIITTPIYTSLLSVPDYGNANTFNSWIDLINIFTCLCVVYSIGRAKLDFKDKFDEYMSSIQGLSSSFGFVVLIFAFLFRERLSAFMHYEVPLVIALFVYLCISPSVEYMMQKTRYYYKYKENILISLITCVAQIAFSITLIFVFNDKRYVGKILGVLLPTFLMGIVFYINLLKKGKCFFKWEYWKYALRISIPMIPHGLAMMILAQVDRIMIRDILGEAESGLYTFGYTFASLLMIFTNAIGQAWLPWFNEQLYANNREGVRKIQKKLVLLGVFLSMGFITVAPEALKILSPGAPDYWAARIVVPPVVLGTLAQYFYTNYVNIEIYHKKTIIIAISSVTAAVLNYFLNAFAIPRFGYVSAAYTTLISYLLLMVMHFLAYRYVLKEKVYADWHMFGYMFATIAAGLGLSLLYSDDLGMILLRYAVALLAFSVFAFINRSDIITLYAYVKTHYLHKSAKEE